MNKSKRIKPMQTVFLGLLFAILLGIGAALFLLPQEAFSENENRVLQTLPAPTAGTVLDGSWQAQFSDFAADQLPLREQMVSFAATLRYTFGAREIGGAWIGANGRLFEAKTARSLPEGLLGKNLSILRSYLEKNDLPCTVLLVPSAAELYPEALPPRATPYDAVALRKTVVAQLGDRVTFPDLAARFAEAKQETGENLYYRTDHHYTAYAAALAAECFAESRGMTLSPAAMTWEAKSDAFYGSLWSKVLLKQIAPDRLEAPDAALPALRQLQITADGKKISLFDESALFKKDKYSYFFGGNHGKMVIDTGREGGTLLLLKDSFANSFLAALLAGEADYARIVVIDLRYYHGSMKHLAEEENITELLVLYGESNFASDPAFVNLIL